MSAARHLDVPEMWCLADLQATRRGRADGIPPRVDGRQPYAGWKVVVGEVAQEGRPGSHLAQARQHAPDEMPRVRPARAAVRGAQRDEVAHMTDAVQLLDVVASDQSACRVAHQIDALARVISSELFDPLGHDVSELLYRPRVETAEEATEVHTMDTVSRAAEPSRQPAKDMRCREEAVHQEHPSRTAAGRR